MNTSLPRLLVILPIASWIGVSAVAQNYEDAPTPPSKPPQPAPSSNYHTANAMSDNKNPKLPEEDRDLLENALDAGMKTATITEAVLPKLTRADVREFATQLLKEHREFNRALQLLATRKAVEAEFHKEMARLTEEWRDKGTDADADYLKELVDVHEKAIKLHEQAAEKAKDAELRDFSQKHLPKLRQHLERARALREKK